MPATKNAAKKVRTKLFKQAKNRDLDSEATAKIEEGDAALKDKRFDDAIAAFEAANPLVLKCPKKVQAKKTPKANAGNGGGKKKAQKEEEVVSDIDVGKLLPISPENNKVAKFSPIQTCSYAVNTPENLAAHLKATGGKWQTRFPPEPNGYLHVGHAKAINFNFLVAEVNGGECLLRFDDTNPAAEKKEYIDMIIENLHWLGHNPSRVTYSSDYFDELYEFAEQLIKQGDAYVCGQSQAEVKASRDLLKQFHIDCAKAEMTREQKRATPLPEGSISPFRERSVEENLRLFRAMKAGEFEEGEVNLRLKQDLYHDDGAMWDTGAYRIKKQPHPRTGDSWCIYPTYDYTHCIVDSIENITHSLCTLEFARRQAPDGPYYWLLDKLGIYKPQTWEYSRGNITCNVMSKRKLNLLVTEGHVNGWDDPRLFTLVGLRRRGYTPASIREFCKVQGVTKNKNTTPFAKLERCIRMELESTAKRVYAVVDPIKVVVENWDEGKVEEKEVPYHPKDASKGARKVAFGKEIYIDRSDFFNGAAADSPVKGFRGLTLDQDVRLLWSYTLHVNSVVADEEGQPVELRCSVDLESAGSRPTKGMGTIHWVADCNAVDITVNLYDNLFTVEEPLSDENKDHWLDFFNPKSLVVTKGKVEASVVADGLGFEAGKFQSYQFTRRGYFCVDKDSTAENPVFNRTTTLRESR
mmetsp:Transcript_11755/g.17011  ORF Transcript_11755/g.17011 Transcript_11755/m.17011 type:complete len:694 (+) Transcript_11755:74-2155(+)|eukprot:CAMPEP_0195508996 /NCGR_PEP_ID=MMETSP0794_2-20130614/2056_1 /TAXON_ID=515487 /ORGANISM="Stephanopyxis turris, Strain CCMP 815" /LENGTH=693 /DNA_ID=CAMNT_0040636103 /DNA_START=64 /DNA_END=2145 /DNA_ORIENTATION=+